MNKALAQKQDQSLLEDERTYRKLAHNYRKNKEQDNTAMMDQLAKDFYYDDCAGRYWNPEQFSLLYGTPLWDQATEGKRLRRCPECRALFPPRRANQRYCTRLCANRPTVRKWKRAQKRKKAMADREKEG